MRRLRHSDCSQPEFGERPTTVRGLNRRSSIRLQMRRVGTLVFAGLIAIIVAPRSFAQLPQARLYSIFPCGGKAGTTIELTLANSTDLDEADRLVFSHPGITATSKTQDVGGQRRPIPNIFEVTIGPHVPPGVYELYAGGLFGLSNPRIFVVGSSEESRESEPNNDRDNPNELTLGKIVNGTISPGTDVDYFRFQGKKGQRITVTCRAADLDSKLSAVLELTGPDGRRLAYAREQLRRDPVIDVVLPADGAYLVRLHDFLFRGGPDYVYRLSVGSMPHVDYILPAAGVAGKTGKFTLYGSNLPGGQPAGVKLEGRSLEKLSVDIELPLHPPVAPAHTTLRSNDAGIDAVSYVLHSPAGDSNPVLIQLVPSVPVLEKEPNDTPATAQEIPAPGEFSGQFQVPGDTDYVAFQAKEGQVLMIDVFAERLGSTADPTFAIEQVVRNAKGEESAVRITSLDDDNTNILPNVFDTRTDDPSYRFTAPADGTYRILLRDRSFESRGDPRMIYHLSIRPEKPDYRLVVLPRFPVQGTVQAVSTWALGLRKGDSRDVEVLVLRRDGFREPIEVSAAGLPPGVSCRGTSIAPNAKTTELIFTAADNAADWTGLIHVVGKARIFDAKKTAALSAADAALKKEAAAVAKLEAIAAGWGDAARKADELLSLTRKAAESAPRDPAVIKSLADAEAAVESIAKAAKTAAPALAAAKKKLADAKRIQQAAAAAAAPTELVHEAIPGSIVWSGDKTDSAVSRIGQSLALSVMKESAPFQLSTDVVQLEVNQSRQILLPLAMARRNGFDGDVAMTITGVANGALDLQNKPFPKGKAAEDLRLFVQRYARVGTYTVYWKTQAQVAYRRNLFAAERAKTEQAQAAKMVTETDAAAKKAVADRELAAKKDAACAATLKSANEKLAVLKQALVAAEQSAKAAADENAKLERNVLEAPALAEATGRLAEFARKAADEAAAATRSASQAAKADAEAKAAAASKVAAQASKAAEDAAAAAKGVSDALAAAQKKLSEARALAKKSNETIEPARKAVTDSEAALKTAHEARLKAEALAKDATSKSQAAAAAKKAADQRAEQAAKVAAPKNVTDFAPSTPIRLTIKPAPIELNASLAKGASLKKGGRLEVKLSVKRNRGFKGPLTIGLPLPAGVKGIKADPITIAAGKKDGVLVIMADASATSGALPNMVARAEMDFDGKAEVDAPLALTVVP